MKRTLASILALSMLLAVALFAGCGETTPPEETTKPLSTTAPSQGTESTKSGDTPIETTGSSQGTESTEPIATTAGGDGPIVVEDPTAKLVGYEDLDFRGKTFTIAVYSEADHSGDWYNEVEIYGGDDTAISVAARTRNSIIEKNYNCHVEALRVAYPSTVVAADIAGNTSTVDLYSLMYGVGTYNTAYNLLALDIDFTNPWWDQTWVKTYSVKDNNGIMKMFGMVGDFVLSANDAIFGIIYNRTIYETSGIQDDIYQLVRDRKWTLDKMMEMSRIAAKEVSGNSEFHFDEGDIMGWVRTNFAPHSLHVASGLSIVQNNDGILSFSMNDHASEWNDVVDKAIEVVQEPHGEEISYTKVFTAIRESRALFASQVLSTLKVVRDADVSLGLVPYPLYSEEQENYYHYVDNHLMNYIIPISVADVDAVADFVEVFAYHSRYTTRTAWIDTYAIEYCGDIESGEMLNIILDSRTYDPGYLIFSTFEGDISNMISTGKNNMTKWAQRSGGKLEEAIQNRLTAITAYNN